MMLWYGHNPGVGGWIVMSISMLLFWALVIGVGAILFRALARSSGSDPGGTPTPTGSGRPSPEQVLAERFARGEIDEGEYQQRLAVLRGSGPPARSG